MTQINPYLIFDGNCLEAMTFYKECLGGELTVMKVAESPMASKVPAHMQQSIMHSQLANGKLLIMGSDMHREKLADGNTVQMNINCSSEEEINSFFSKLSAGGKITEPLGEMFWGALFGALTDRFGKHWLFNYEKNQK